MADEKSDTVTGKEDDDAYEYYYVYYDESGNVVNTAAAKETSPVHSEDVQTKLQEISLQATPAATLISNDKVPGDTPTIYAEIKEPSKHAEAEKNTKKPMTIFGIPIPSLPMNFPSFSLAPALSQGLLPLPVGRKGDGSASDMATDESKTSGISVPAPSVPTSDGTRGPDSALNKIWIETGLKTAGLFLPQIVKSFSSLASSSSSSSKRSGEGSEDDVEEDNTAKRHTNPDDFYNYAPPSNLQPGASQELPRYFPSGQQQQAGEYFPKGYIPAIKFDHPVRSRPHGLSGGSPVYPPPSQGHSVHQQSVQSSLNRTPPRRHYLVNDEVDRRELGSVGFGSSQTDVNGFRPLFRPNKADPFINGGSAGSGSNGFSSSIGDTYPKGPEPSAFPGIDASLKLPPGFRTPTVEKPLPPFKQPSIQFTSPTNDIRFEEDDDDNEDQAGSDSDRAGSVVNTLGPAFEAVPEKEKSTLYQEEDLLKDASLIRPTDESQATEGPLITSLFSKATGSTSSTTSTSTTTSNEEYEYYYEDDVDDALPSFRPPTQDAGEEEIQRLLQQLREQGVPVSERTVPTLQVEEVTTSKNVVSTESIGVNHRGTPKNLQEATTSNSIDLDTTSATSESSTEAADNKEEYEYEYYYEYYEDDEGSTTEASSESTTTSQETEGNILEDYSYEEEIEEKKQSLDDIFNLMKAKGVEAQPQQSPHPFDVRRPTIAPAIRTSTVLYDVNGNYLESQRSSISASRIQSPPQLVSSTLTSVERSTRRDSSSSPYPFHPDHLDPARQPNVDDKVKWYYANYNEEKRGPFVGPGAEEVLGSSAVTYQAAVLLPLVLGSILHRVMWLA